MLVDAITDYAIYMLDLQGIISSWNPGARRFKGYEEAEIVGQHFSRFYTEADRASGLPQRALEAAIRDGKFESEGWRVRKDGTRFWAYVVIDLIRDASGNPVGFAKITRDLTERKQAETALRNSQEQFRLLVNGVTDYAIYLLKRDGTVASWNSGAQRIKGYTRDEIVGQHFSRFYTEEDKSAGLPERALEIAEREGRFEKEGWRVRKDGTIFWANVVIDAIRHADGSLLGFAKITRDITARKDTERALEETRQALVQSQKMEALGRLTGGVAHDFNNLLMAIQGSLELLQRNLPNDNPKIGQLLDNALQGTQRGAALTQRMLSFARRQELKPIAVNVPVLLNGMTELLQRSLDPSIRIDMQFPASLPPALVDANQLELAILNLAVNARDAMPKGGTMVVSARDHIASGSDGSAPQRYLCITIADSGTGMDDKTLAHAMEPFFTTKGVGKGTGLGLPMVHGMAQQSGGKLVLKSQLGVGTTAELWLPVALAEAASVKSPVTPTRVTRSDRKLVILTVDDDPLVGLNTSSILEELGHKVHSASSGTRALEILEQESDIELLITDQAMPHMTGIDLIRTIRAERPDFPAIIATGYAELPHGEADGIPKLAKPFRQQDLAAIIDEAMSSASSPPHRIAREA
ncbi:PAS domain S-box protein [Afipia clevelandensis ATCC 49720]|uniref:histidine kinase n=2 Tax=Afipia clevelandensis TaxID=1034 RepID=K8NS82_9BRAD|nr:PAS domain-containing sensor histidine kinase [Afipia clevelandensis]EKS31986.1 PAS domain S-box protein [Afipia clevelandensis ATCC 49720]